VDVFVAVNKKKGSRTSVLSVHVLYSQGTKPDSIPIAVSGSLHEKSHGHLASFQGNRVYCLT